MKDPYELLGVKRSATADEIRRAYRKLAKELHPDLHPGKPEYEARFKEVSAANELLSDPVKRARFDRGEIDASGAEMPRQRFYRDFAEQGAGAKYRGTEGAGDFEDIETLFGGAFRDFARARGGGKTRLKMRGADRRYTLTIDFLEAVNGAAKRVAMPDGRDLDIKIPAGIDDGQTLRLAGQGMPGIGGGPPGDALIDVRVAPHPVFRRDGDDIRLDLPITLGEAVNGAKIAVPTVHGKVTLTIPKGANSGTTLRLKGKGVLKRKSRKHGDQYVTLKLVLPEKIDDQLAAFIADWAPEHPYDPRRRIEEETS